MKTFTEIDQCNEILKDFINAAGQIWLFDVTHKRLVIRLWIWSQLEHKVKKEIFIAALGCEHIRAPFQWKNTIMSIIKEIDPQSGEPLHKIIDKNSDFELVANAGVVLLDSLDSKNK